MKKTITAQPAEDTSFAWYTFDQLEKDDLYTLLQLRQQVFIVEQNCPYLDADNIDRKAYHLLARSNTPNANLLGYLRVIPPGPEYTEPAIGRILTAQQARGKGLGRELMIRAIDFINTTHPCMQIKISAQLYLLDFYKDLGFDTISEPYDEDGIPHITMVHRVLVDNSE